MKIIQENFEMTVNIHSIFQWLESQSGHLRTAQKRNLDEVRNERQYFEPLLVLVSAYFINRKSLISPTEENFSLFKRT